MKNPLLSLLLCIFFVCGYSQNLELEWGFETGGFTGIDRVFGTAIDDSDHVYTIGHLESVADWDPGPADLILTPQNGRNAFLRKLDSQGNLLWIRQTIASGDAESFRINVDRRGNIYVAGFFEGIIDLDPGPDTLLATSKNASIDIFVQKFDPAGNLLKAITLEGNLNITPSCLETDDLGNVFLVGAFRDSVDFDPSPNSTEILVGAGRSSGQEIFIQKLDASLNLIWVKKLAFETRFNLEMVARGFHLTPGGDILLGGYFENTIDVDPDTSKYLLTSVSNDDAFLLKWDTDGNFVWAKQFEGSADFNFRYGNIFTGADKDITVIGMFHGMVDFDPDSGLAVLNSNRLFNFEIYFLRLDSTGAFKWVKTLRKDVSSATFGLEGGIDEDHEGNFYISGIFSDTTDFDPGPGIFNVIPMPTRTTKQAFIAKYDKDINLVWVEKFGDFRLGSGMTFGLDGVGSIYHTGTFQDSIDIDPTATVFNLNAFGNWDLYSLKFKPSCSDLTLVVDSVQDVSCGGPGFASAFGLNGSPPYTYSWDHNPIPNDSSISFPIPGYYTLNLSDGGGCSKSASVLIGGPALSQTTDIKANLITTDFRPGFPTKIWIDAFNTTCTPFSGELILQVDPWLEFDSASIAPDRIKGDSLIWNLNNLAYDSAHFKTCVFVRTKLEAVLGENLCLGLDVPNPNVPILTKNLVSRPYCYEVIGSYDPNDKLVYPKGDCQDNLLKKDELLTYTVRFQNTGNASAINVFILDTLDANLDLKSVKILASSHSPMITELLPDRVLKFRFDNIQLPDSNTNEALSHGYVVYEVQAWDSLTDGTLVENSASIFFDFNDPVITPAVQNTLWDMLPASDTTRISIASCGRYSLNNRSYSRSGTYFQRLISRANCDSILQLDLTLYPDQSIDTTISVSSNQLRANTADVTYQWIDCNNDFLPILSATEQTFTPLDNGSYAVILNNGICSVTSSCINMTRVNKDEELKALLTYYPNPTSDKILIELGRQFVQIEVDVNNVVGQKLSSYEFYNKEKLEIELPGKPGVFLIHLKLDEKTAVLKVMKN